MDIVDIVAELIKLGAHPDVIASVSGLAARAEIATAELERLAAIRESSRQRASRYREKIKQNQLNRNVTVTLRPPYPPYPPKERSPTPPKEITPLIPPSPSLRESDSIFEIFWKIFPKRQGPQPKKPALVRWRNAVRSGVDPELIISGARRYAIECRNLGKEGTIYVLQAQTWLNQEQWQQYGNVLPLFSNGHDKERDVAP